MDDTQQSRTSDAAATRKRRSSILKSQRSVRAPLSELEFHVATPTDTAKSRRVSFSKRTGVAEFVTNEATTTWKNFYEEHNKSLESSGNESHANPPRPSSVGHLGKRIFEDQFQEVEIIDYGSTVNESRGVENSMNNVKFDQFALECTADDRKLSAPGPHFERTFTASEQPSKLFGNDLAISGFGEISDRINVDFSNIQPVCDDLDEIQKDLQRHQGNQQNFLCPGPLNGRNMSGYIEVDLNTTHATVDCGANSLTEDMSITDTIHSPKVNVSKNSSLSLPDRCLNKDWVADKENIAVNPYLAPKESANFAINEIPDQVLVFDGKRLTLQSEKEPITDYRKTLISTEPPNKPPQRKTIVINVDDDLPNFVANPHTSMSQHTKNCSANLTLQDDNCDISMTQPLPARIETSSNKRQTIVFADTSGNISMTQALPTNIAPEKHEKRRTIVFENDTADISVTQAVPANIIFPTQNVSVRDSPVKKQPTMVFENKIGDISMTQAQPTNMVLGKSQVTEKRKTIVFDEEDGNISVTKAIPSNILISDEAKYVDKNPFDVSSAMLSIPPRKFETNKRKSIVFNDEDGNISVTKAISSHILLPEETNYIKKSAFEDVDVKLSIPYTEIESNKKKTIVFNDDDGNISVTKPIPATKLFKEDVKLLQNAPSAETHKRKTIVFDDEDGNISVTKSIPSNIIISEDVKLSQNASSAETHKRKTIVFDDEDADISVTKAIPSNIIISEDVKLSQNAPSAETHKRKTIVFDDEDGNISVTKAIPSNIIISEDVKLLQNAPSAETHKRKTIVFDDEGGNISVTKAIPSNIIISEDVKLSQNASSAETHKRKTIVFDDEDGNISVTKAIPSNIIISEEVKPLESAETHKRKTVFDVEGGNLSLTEAIPSKIIISEKTKHFQNTILEETSAISSLSFEQETNKRKTIVFDDEDGNFSVTKAIPTNILVLAESNTFKSTLLEETDVPSQSSHLKSGLEESTQEDKNTSLRNALTSNLTLHGKETNKSVTLNKENQNNSTMEALHSKILLKKDNFELLDEMQYSSNHSRRLSSSPKINMAYEDDIDISMTQMLPSNIISTEQGKTEVYDQDARNVSVMETVPANIVLPTTVCDTDSVKIPTLTEKHIITDNNDEQMKTYTKSCHETSPTQARLSKSIIGCLPKNNESIEIESESKIVSVKQMDTSDVDLNMSTKSNKSLYNNARDVSLAKVVPECIRELESALNPIKPSTVMQENVANLDNVDPTNTANTKEDQDDMSIINLEDTLNRSQSKEDKIVLQIVNTTYQNNCAPDLNNFTGVKEKLNINISRTDTQSRIVYHERGDASSAISSDNAKEKPMLISPDKNNVIKAELVPSKISIPSSTISSHKSGIDFDLKSNKKDSNTTVSDVIIPIYTSSTNIEDVNTTNTNIQIATKSNSTITSTSEDNLFYITKDCDRGAQTENSDDWNIIQSNFKLEEDMEIDFNKSKNCCIKDPKEKLESNPGEIKHLEKVCRKSYKDADCTKDLLDMLSKFTEQEEEEQPLKDTCKFTSEKKTEFLPERLLSYPRRQSVVLSREDLMNNISMAQAMLQSSAASHSVDSEPDLDSSASGEPELDSPASAGTPSPNRNSRLSSEVVKTLHFEDDDSSTDPKESTTNFTTSLIKTSLNKSSLIKEHKEGLLIPANLKDVSGKIQVERQYKHKLLPCNRQVQVDLIPSNETIGSNEGNRTHNYTDHTALGAIPFDLHNPLNNVLLGTNNVKENSEYGNTFNRTGLSADEESIRNQSIKESLEDVKSEDNLMQPTNSATSKNTSKVSSGVLLKDAELDDQMMPPDSGTSKNATHETSPYVSTIKMNVSCSESQQPPPAVEPNINSIDDNQRSEMKSKYEKRKHKTCSRSPLEVTPRPASKIPKRSVSPDDHVSEDSDRAKQRLKQQVSIIAVKSASETERCPETMDNSIVIVAQQLAADHRTEQDDLEASGAVEKSEHNFSGSSGGKNTEDLNNEMEIEPQSSVPSSPSCGQDDELDAIAVIDRLPCILNGEVEWERRSDEEWSFLLLHRRVRLIVRLAPTLAARRQVRASTPITDVTIKHSQPVEIPNKTNASGALCVQFSLETMRRVLAGLREAGEAAGAVARCAAVARLAARWMRAMHLSWGHLAYSLTQDGRLHLCVANTPLRSVWEVSMTIELADDAKVPYPEARSIVVTPLISCTDVTPGDVMRCVRGVSADWGHAPRTLWKIFKYLKNKPLEEQFLGGLTAHKH